MKLALSILMIALCASAQDMMPPKVVPPAVQPVKQHIPQPIRLEWSPSPSPGVASYNAYAATNGVIWYQTNVTGTDAIVYALPGTNYFYARAVGSDGEQSALSAPCTHSGWGRDVKVALEVLTNAVVETNIVVDDSTNSSEGLFRSAVSADDVMMQRSQNLSSWTTVFTSDIDNFPSIFAARAVIITSVINIP